jgi:hypothetical protein
MICLKFQDSSLRSKRVSQKLTVFGILCLKIFAILHFAKGGEMMEGDKYLMNTYNLNEVISVKGHIPS